MSSKKVVTELSPYSPEAEAFRILRTNLQFSAVHRPFKTLLVTSAAPSEGKSTLTANLGIVMAQAGAKVIIVDCDLREAKQHIFFGLPNETGLTTVLLGSTELEHVLKETELPNLKLIPSGPPPPNPAELLSSQKAKDVFLRLSDMADIVLVDSPSVLTVADTVVLSSILDGVVLVIKAARTKIDAFKQAKERLEKAEARIIGTILNAVDVNNDYYHYKKKSEKDMVFRRIKVLP